ncbi:MAG: hypothetical protein AB7F59_11590 [Bdellovibrionales bacterium]
MKIPQGLLIFLVLVGGLIFILLAQPPHSVCEPQMEIFKTSQEGFLFLNPSKSYLKTTGFQKTLDFCKHGNNAGSCFEFMQGLQKMMDVTLSSPAECHGGITELTEVSSATWRGLELMTRAAWGAAAPKSSMERQGWLDAPAMELYCRLKKFAITNYGQGAWSSFVESQLPQLPGASELQRSDAWQRTILSDPCQM